MPAPIEAIDIDGADKEHGPLESTGKDVLRAVHIVALVALPGQILHTVPVCQCREMDDAVNLFRLHDLAKPFPVGKIGPDKAAVIPHRLFAGTSDADNLIISGKEFFYQRRADHPSCARDKNRHAVPSPVCNP